MIIGIWNIQFSKDKDAIEFDKDNNMYYYHYIGDHRIPTREGAYKITSDGKYLLFKYKHSENFDSSEILKLTEKELDIRNLGSTIHLTKVTN